MQHDRWLLQYAPEIVGGRGAADLDLEHLTERRGQVLRGARGDAAGSLGHECAVDGIGVGCAATRGRAIERVVGGGGAVVGQVAGIVRISLA